MRRREFITLLVGATATWPLAAGAQQGERVRRIGVLMNLPQTMRKDRRVSRRSCEAGWRSAATYGSTIAGEAPAMLRLFRKYTAELVALAPDVILASGNPSVAALQQATRSVPIVFAPVT